MPHSGIRRIVLQNLRDPPLLCLQNPPYVSTVFIAYSRVFHEISTSGLFTKILGSPSCGDGCELVLADRRVCMANPLWRPENGRPGDFLMRVDVRLLRKENSNSHGARPVHVIITMIKWIRTGRLSIKNSHSLCARAGAPALFSCEGPPP